MILESGILSPLPDEEPKKALDII